MHSNSGARPTPRRRRRRGEVGTEAVRHETGAMGHGGRGGGHSWRGRGGTGLGYHCHCTGTITTAGPVSARPIWLD